MRRVLSVLIILLIFLISCSTGRKTRLELPKYDDIRATDAIVKEGGWVLDDVPTPRSFVVGETLDLTGVDRAELAVRRLEDRGGLSDREKVLVSLVGEISGQIRVADELADSYKKDVISANLIIEEMHALLMLYKDVLQKEKDLRFKNEVLVNELKRQVNTLIDFYNAGQGGGSRFQEVLVASMYLSVSIVNVILATR